MTRGSQGEGSAAGGRADHDHEGGLKSVAAALDLLDCFAQDEELGVSEVARRLGVAKSTAHRLLTTLATRDLIEKNLETGRYRLGLHLFELGHLAVSRLELRRNSMRMLEELREVSGWTVHLSVPEGVDTLFLERLPTLRGLSAMTEFKRRWPLHATSSGKAICAYNPEVAQRRIDAGLPAYTQRTIHDEATFRREMGQIRQHGYAVSREELMAQLGSVAAPVLDRNGIARAAISITGSIAEMGTVDRQARLVMTAARRVSRSLTSV